MCGLSVLILKYLRPLFIMGTDEAYSSVFFFIHLFNFLINLYYAENI